jgi:hypothetical protein
LSGSVSDEEPEPRDVFAEVHDEVAGLLGGPGSVGVRGHAEDVQVSVADLECEQDVEPLQCHRAVDVEEVDHEHAGGLRAQSRVGPADCSAGPPSELLGRLSPQAAQASREGGSGVWCCVPAPP